MAKIPNLQLVSGQLNMAHALHEVLRKWNWQRSNSKTKRRNIMDRAFFKLFFLCEDWESMNRALELKQKLVQNCQGQVVIDADFYEYVRLSHPVLRSNAVARAIASDMIIMVAEGTEAVPSFIREWMNEVGTLRPGNMVCAEFLGAASPEKAATFHGCMDKWASRCGSFLFSNLFPHSADLSKPAVEGLWPALTPS